MSRNELQRELDFGEPECESETWRPFFVEWKDRPAWERKWISEAAARFGIPLEYFKKKEWRQY